jgi:hypothetical protein
MRSARLLITALLSAAGAALPLASQATNVNVSVGISQPGFYGRVDIGSEPPPPVIYAQPVIITPAPYAHVRPPIYLRVRPGEEREWGRYCARYAACGQPVYFVRDLPPPRHEHHDHGRHEGHGDRDHGPDRGHDHGHDRDH